MSRTLFDVAERKGFLSLSMSNLINMVRMRMAGPRGFDFVRVSPAALVLSAVLMVVGVVAMFARGSSIFDIDFSGGSSVTFRVQDATSTDTVRSIVAQSLAQHEGGPGEFTVNNVSMESAPERTIFKVDSSIESVEELKDLIRKGFTADGSVNLVTYEIEVVPAESSETSQSSLTSSATTLVMLRAQDEAEVPAADEPADAEPAPAEAAAPEAPAAEQPAATDSEASAPAASGVLSRSRLRLGIDGNTQDAAGINAQTLTASLGAAAERAGVAIDLLGVELDPVGEDADQWSPGSELRFSEWEVALPLAPEQADLVMNSLRETLGQDPVWISSSSVGSRVAGDMINRALGALFGSLICIAAYIWFRFNHAVYGMAAVAALIHDVLITLGAIAISYWVADYLGFLMIDQFKISLTVVAALLTIVGYSLNDTIVVFDRIRETKGKSPRLTTDMINTSINSTLSRTLLTSITTLMVVVLLYFFGGEGIHAFAFCLVVGVSVGTYSSIFIASPIMFWLISRDQATTRSA